MKVISLLQPWATLVVIGAKKIETRGWNTKYRGEILIHASAGKNKINRGIMLDFQQEFYELQLPKYEDLPFESIIGKVNIVNTVHSEVCFLDNEFEWRDNHFKISHQELAFGNYSDGRYGWLLSDPVKFANPIPAKGKLSIWDYDMPDHFHVANKYGGHATFPTPPDQRTLDAVNRMTELAYKNLK